MTLRFLLLLAAGLATGGGCRINFGGGGNYGNIDLKVPYYSQPDILLCGPTSVLMWRRYDAFPYISPQQLGDLMGCPWRTSGCSLDQIVAGTRFYTTSGRDAFLDDYGGVVGDPMVLEAQYFSRQITSLKNGAPVIAPVDGALHAVVVHAGNYTTASNGLKQWDYVYVHDPFVGYGYRQYTAGAWMNTNFQQVISVAGMQGWEGNFDTYGDEVQVRGGGGVWPPQNQYNGLQGY